MKTREDIQAALENYNVMTERHEKLRTGQLHRTMNHAINSTLKWVLGDYETMDEKENGVAELLDVYANLPEMREALKSADGSTNSVWPRL